MDDDWRLHGQERYLMDVTLYWRKYTRYSPSWDHDHCDFCKAIFTEPADMPEALHEGYTTEDNYYWVCENCFNDFRELFGWNAVKHDAE
jgi:hypothetical protein